MIIKCLYVTKSGPGGELIIQGSLVKPLASDKDLRVTNVWYELHVKLLGYHLTNGGLADSEIAFDENDFRVVIKPFPRVVKKLPKLIVRSRLVWPWGMLSLCRLPVRRRQVRNLR